MLRILVWLALMTAASLGATRDAVAQRETATAGDEDLAGGVTGDALDDLVKDVEWIGFQQFQNVSRVFVRTTEPVRYTIDGARPDVVTVELHNTTVMRINDTNHLDTSYFDSPVYFVQAKLIEGPSPSVRVEIRLRRQVQIADSQRDTLLALDFARR